MKDPDTTTFHIPSESGSAKLKEQERDLEIGSAQEDQKKHQGSKPGILPGVCDGALTWNLIFTFWCCFTVILPILLYVGIGAFHSIIAASVLLGVGFAYFLFSLRGLFLGGVCCRPTNPPRSSPFARGSETHVHVDAKKLYVLCNPVGGLRSGKAILERDVIPILQEKHGITLDIKFTEYAGHARDLAQTLDFKGYDGLCAIGGDGTLHEIVNGMLTRKDKQQIPIGLIPGGSGNSFCMDIGRPTPAEAAERIASGSTMAIDAMQVRDETSLDIYGLNVVAFAVVATAGGLAERCRCLGPARYDICGLWQILVGYYKTLSVSIDESSEEKNNYFVFFANNTQHFGKGLRVCPKAKLDDGMLDLVACPDQLSRGEALQLFQHLPTGAHINSKLILDNPRIKIAQVKQFTVKGSKSRGILNLDGEIIEYEGRVDVRCIPGAFRMFIPSL